MDATRIERLKNELIGEKIGGWELVEYINAGKTALVFKGNKDGLTGAVKIFDPELVERFGREIQLQRINRELELIGHDCPNLINILGGGESPDFLYLVMEFLDWPSLDQVVSEVPSAKIWKLIGDVATAAEYLEKKNIAHRDIKPSNIIINPEFSEIKLLDLGVIRPIGDSDLTDLDAKSFIGTLRYSSPELLYRTEKDTIEGWRAVSFYQIGAVLHDVIMNEVLFKSFSDPYPRLIDAVKIEIPHVEDGAVDPDLIFLARNCLAKDPLCRLELLTWDSFHLKQEETTNIIKRTQRLKQRQVAAESKMTTDSVVEEKQKRTDQRATSEIFEIIESIIRHVSISSEFLPPSKFHVSRNAEDRIGIFITRFEASTQYVLSSGFSICFEVSVVNNLEKSLVVKCGVIAGKAVEAKQFKTEKCSVAYNGVLEKHVLQKQIDNLFHSALDEVQERYSTSQMIEDNAWIELKEL
ncbi:MAG: protein kinase [Thermodesulfobacteriota bacterium]